MSENLVAAFRRQAAASAQMGSPMMGHLLARATEDIAAGGVIADLLRGWRGDPAALALPLRLMAVVHEQVLDGALPDLAVYYPSVGGTFEPDGAWEQFRRSIEREADRLRPLLQRPLQTNEVRRSALLLPGFLTIAAESALPLRLLEVGASAGLNLNWDRYHYQLGAATWGPASSPLSLAVRWHGDPPPVHVRPKIASRLGSDPHPIDPREPGSANRLLSFIWPDQPARLARLRAALAVAGAWPPALERAGAADFAAGRLRDPVVGEATVFYHSVVWQYLAPAEQERVQEILREAGARATDEAPLYWMRMEAGEDGRAALLLDGWPGGWRRILARSQWHARWIEWRGG